MNKQYINILHGIKQLGNKLNLLDVANGKAVRRMLQVLHFMLAKS